MKIRPVILSGGAGTRLWPLSRAATPKQLLALTGEQSLLQQTALRTAGEEDFLPPVVIANVQHRSMIAEQLDACGTPAETIVLEPDGKNTAPAIALAAWLAAFEGRDAALLVMPSDHVIDDRAAFLAAIRRAAGLVAAEDRLVTFGITPDRPETGYGYIEQGAALKSGDAFEVRRFVEKPDAKTAETYLTAGTFLWNSGMFLFSATAYLDALERHRPEMANDCKNAAQPLKGKGLFLSPDARSWGGISGESVDYAVMENDDHIAVVPLSAGWSDVGSWRALWEIAPQGRKGNAVFGDVIDVACTGSYLRSERPLVAAVGLTDVVVVATPDAVLVADQARVQEVKTIVERLEKDGRTEHLRPTGHARINRITLEQGSAHAASAAPGHVRHLVVGAGVATVRLDDQVTTLHRGAHLEIAPDTRYRIENNGSAMLECVQVDCLFSS